MKNTGLNLELEAQHQSQQDWIFGSGEPLICLTSISEADRDRYLPVGEVQKGAEDTMDCASRAAVNILETKFTWLYDHKMSESNKKWLEENGYYRKGRVSFSDAFVAINSGTTRNGNSLIAPLKAIHEKGLIPKDTLPLETFMTWDEYHRPARITPEMVALGKEFLRRFDINFERVYEENYEEILNADIMEAAGYAWPNPVDGIYPRTDRSPNHAFMLFKNPKYYAFDNYIDSVDGDFTKRLASDYDLLSYGYRIVIPAEYIIPTAPPVTPVPVVPAEGFWSRLAQIISWFLTPKTI